MADDTTTTTATTNTTAAPPWHTGIEPDTIGFWQNKGYPLDDPKALASELTKQYRAAEKHIGAPPDELLRLPKANAPEADVKAFLTRLGVPAEAKEYDLTAIKRADGSELPAPLADALRAAALAARTPKDRAGEFAKEIVKHLDAEQTAAATVLSAKLTEEKTTLAKNWATTPDKLDVHPNMAFARIGAQRAGLTPEAVAALEKQTGYAAVMDHCRKLGMSTSEDTFHDSNRGPGGHPTTLEGAKAKLAELESDKAWGKRLRDKDAATVAEWRALTTQIAKAEAA